MALGGITTSIESGGGRSTPSLADASKNLILFGCAPDGAENTLRAFSSPNAAKAALANGSTGGELAECVAKLLQHDAPIVYAVPCAVSTNTAMSSVTAGSANVGTGAPTVADRPHRSLTIRCVTSGAIATAAFRFSDDGGVTYGATVTSADSGGGSWVYRPLGWFVTLTFPNPGGGGYVAGETRTFPINSATPSDSGGWVGAVTAACSVIDNYRPKIEVLGPDTAAAGTSGTVSVRASLDGGITYLPPIPVGTSGVFVIPGSGIEVTLGAGTYQTGDTFTWYAAAPLFSTPGLNAALTAAMQDATSPQVATIMCVGVNSDANVVTDTATLQTYLATARNTYGKQWHLAIAPGIAAQSAGDVLGASGTAAASARTDAQIATALIAATETNNVSVFVATQEMASPLSGLYLRRPTSWMIAARIVETSPSEEPAYVARGALDCYTSAAFPLHRDESTASTALIDARANVLTRYPGRSGAYLAIQSGVAGWRNMTGDASYSYAAAVRVLAVMLEAVTTRAQNYIGATLRTNTDGTIAEVEAAQIEAELLTVASRAVGLAKGGAFASPQASSVDVTVDRDSQLGSSPKRLDINYTFQPLGEVTDVQQRVLFSGSLTVTG